MQPPKITAEQRDALYEQILDRLSGIEDLWLAVCASNFSAAQRLGREYSDDLRLVLDDLGWGAGSGEDVELTTPPDVLIRVFTRLKDISAQIVASEAEEEAELRDFQENTRLVAAACERVLSALSTEPRSAP